MRDPDDWPTLPPRPPWLRRIGLALAVAVVVALTVFSWWATAALA